MSSASAPSYYFYGINFNSSFFSSSSDLTITKLNGLYLSKVNTDTALSAITFNSGLNSSLINARSAGDNITLFPTGTGNITIGSASTPTLTLNSNFTYINKFGNYGIETSSGSGNALLDFHSSNTASDYDSRIIASGGNSTSGQGNLDITAATVNINSTTTNINGPTNLSINGNRLLHADTNPTTSQSLLDFRSSNNSGVADSRIISTGGSATPFQGTLSLQAATVNIDATTTNINGTTTNLAQNGNYGIETNAGGLSAWFDFHSSNTGSDYDCRILSSGGSATSGQGQLTLQASTLQFNGTVSGLNYLTGQGGGVGKVLGTIYRNSGNMPKFVSVSVSSGSIASVQALVDSATPPTTVAVQNSMNAFATSMFFIVLPNYYYKINIVSGSPTLVAWTEWV